MHVFTSQVTNLVWSTGTDDYQKWCFKILRKLKIHCLSQSDEICKACCLPSRDPLKNVYDIEELEDIVQGINIEFLDSAILNFK